MMIHLHSVSGESKTNFAFALLVDMLHPRPAASEDTNERSVQCQSESFRASRT